MATINMHMKFEIEIPKQTWLMLRNHVVYRQTDGETDKVNPVYPPSNFVGREYNYIVIEFQYVYYFYKLMIYTVKPLI